MNDFFHVIQLSQIQAIGPRKPLAEEAILGRHGEELLGL